MKRKKLFIACKTNSYLFQVLNIYLFPKLYTVFITYYTFLWQEMLGFSLERETQL